MAVPAADQSKPPRLTIIIPTLNEAEHLPALLNDLLQQQGVVLEIIIGDGGSSDTTAAIAEAFGVRLVRARRGRGTQMNAAAGEATGNYLLCLHADSRLTDPSLLSQALEALRQAELDDTRVAGHFRLRFLRSDQRNRLGYRYLEEKTTQNRVNTTNGDQGMLLSRQFFTQLGGFDDSLPFLEDQRIAEQIRSQGRWITLPGELTTSARRFEAEGFHRRYLLMGVMMGLYNVGEHTFFTRAPEVYRVQEETGKLRLWPFFALLWSMVRRDWGFMGTLRTFYRLGRYIRRNSWQLFFFLDVWLRPILGPGRYPLLTLHDRAIAPYTDLKLLDGLVGLLCFGWYMGILTAFFGLTETVAKRWPHHRRPHATSG